MCYTQAHTITSMYSTHSQSLLYICKPSHYYMTADLQTMHVELPSTEVLCVYMRKVIVFWKNFKIKNLCGDLTVRCSLSA